MEGLARRVPMAQNAIDRLKKSEFKDVSGKGKEVNQCIICMVDFQENDLISELACDGRHIFHTDCLHEWLKHDLRCPMCKKAVDGSD